MNHPAIATGRVAVITGGASGIGLAVAERLHALGMKLCLADVDAEALAAAGERFGAEALTVLTDVSDLSQVEHLKTAAYERFGEVGLLMNNAGVGGGGRSAFDDVGGWHRILDVNLWGVINGLQTFTAAMIAQGTPCAIVNTGSKQGITNPPGGAAYNVSKAGIRTVTEHLAHELRNIDGCRVTAHLLVPGATFTGLARRRLKEKPPGSWEPSQVADELLRRMGNGDFYIICPDNDVSTALDNARLQWNTDDIIRNRPALSRWHPDYAAEFAEYVKGL